MECRARYSYILGRSKIMVEKSEKSGLNRIVNWLDAFRTLVPRIVDILGDLECLHLFRGIGSQHRFKLGHIGLWVKPFVFKLRSEYDWHPTVD